MKIILANGTELNPLSIKGAPKEVQGAKRDTLSFIFSGNEDINALDNAFSEAACESIKIIGDNESETVYKGYAIRAELRKVPMRTELSTDGKEALIENRIIVSMAQRTYTETQLSALNALLTGEE